MTNNFNHLAILDDQKINSLYNLLRFVPSSMGEAVIVTDLYTNILFINRMAEKLTGYSQVEALKSTLKELFGNEKIGEIASITVNSKLYNGAVARFEDYTSIITKTGEELSITGSIAPIKNDADQILGLVITFFNITEQKQLEKRLKYASMHDALTGLYNRAYFEYETLNIAVKHHHPVGLIVCDIDGLKIVNDTLGHKAGDNLLISAAKIFKNCFREGDVIARIGGDEFAILISGSNYHVLSDACRRIRENISRYNENNSGLPLSVSIGFALSKKLPPNITSLFKEADNNMYREKLHHNRSIRSTVVNTIMRMIGARDFITEGHCERLKNLVELMAVSLGLSENTINDLKLLAEFHDIGKVGISDGILLKPGPLTPEEKAEMQRHCEIGHHIAMSSPDLAHIANWILKHHEWWNGHGYPQGIKGENIPLECRVLAIVDAYDAMTSNRPYRKAWSQQEALSELKKYAGSQFDPSLVTEFIRVLESLKIYIATSVKDTMYEIKQAYINDHPKKNLLFRFGSSGILKQQIENGALADIFIPASTRQMNELQAKDLIVAETRENLLQNKVVLIASKQSLINCNFKELVEAKIQKIAIGNPDTVPAGKYAQEVLTSLGIWEIVKPKFTFTRDVRQVLNYIETGKSDIGIVYQTDAIISDKVKILDQAPLNSHSPVVYPVAVIKGGNNEEDSKKFLKYLTSEKAKKIFKKNGFSLF